MGDEGTFVYVNKLLPVQKVQQIIKGADSLDHTYTGCVQKQMRKYLYTKNGDRWRHVYFLWILDVVPPDSVAFFILLQPSVEGSGDVFNGGRPQGPVPGEFNHLQGLALIKKQLV